MKKFSNFDDAYEAFVSIPADEASIIYCHRSIGYYVEDTSIPMLRGFEKLIAWKQPKGVNGTGWVDSEYQKLWGLGSKPKFY